MATDDTDTTLKAVREERERKADPSSLRLRFPRRDDRWFLRPRSPTNNQAFHDGLRSPTGLRCTSPVRRAKMQLARVVIGVDLTEASVRAATWVANRFAPDAEMVL